jgi:hypothetical protein
LTAAFLTGAAFFAAFVGATFTAAFLTAVFFVTAFFAGAFAAAFCKRQRFFVAAMILFIPSSLIRRFAFGALAGAGGSDSPLILAHRFLCAIAILRRAAAEILCFRGVPSGLAADSAGLPDSMARSSAILVSMCRFCSSNPRMAAVMISVVSFVGMSAFRTIHVNAIFPVRSVAAVGGEFLENLALNFVIKPHPNDGPGRMLIWDGPLQDTWLLQHPSVGLPIPAQLCFARAHPGLSSQGHIMVVCTTRSVQPDPRREIGRPLYVQEAH